MVNLALLVVDVWFLSGVLLLLHYRSPRIGFIPFIVITGGLATLLQVQFGVYIEPFDGFIMFLSSGVLVPLVLMSVLVIYVTNGAVAARLLIYSILGISLLVLLIITLYRLHIALPGGYTFQSEAVQQALFRFNTRVTLASLVAFAADMFVIAVFYQGVHNHAPRTPEWLVIGITLVAALWTDAIVFGFVADFGTLDFLEVLPGDLASKTLSALILWPPVAFYMTRFAPGIPGYIGSANRRTFDLLFGSFEEIKLALSRTAQALEESETARQQEARYFKQIADNINEALWLTEPYRHNAFYVNPAYERLFGRSAQNIYADPGAFVNAIHPDDQARVLAGLVEQVRGSYNVEYRVVRPDGTIRWVRDRAFPVADAQGAVYQIAGITEDITEQKKAEKQRLELAIEREKVKMLRNFISEASHDLKTPLTSISLKVNQFTRVEDPEQRRRVARELEQQASRLGGMINDILTLARLENTGELTLTHVNLKAMIEEIVETMRPQMDEKQLQVRLALADSQPLIGCDTIDLSRALANLIDNAVRYTPEGGQISVATALEGGEVLIRVTDTGIGIGAADQARIFDRFHRSKEASQLDPSGTGLGLAIVRRVVEIHNGRIEVSSQPGAGTTFSIWLPVAS